MTQGRLKRNGTTAARSTGLSYGVLGLAVGGIWWVVSSKLPPRDKPWRALLPGAVLVAAGVTVLEILSFFLVGPRLAHKSQIYGALGIAAMVLLWLYLLGRLMVACAIVNASQWEQRLENATSAPEQEADR